MDFEWDTGKELINIIKHGVSFYEASEVFYDPHVIFLEDDKHSTSENRYYAVGKNKKGTVLAVRYTVRDKIIRIFGAAAWRKWRKYYEKENS